MKRPSGPDFTEPSVWIRWIAPGTLLLLHAVLVIWSISGERKLPTVDEPMHLMKGELIWTEGRYDYDKLNPPLTPMVVALPFRVLHPALPENWRNLSLSTMAHQFLYKNRVPMETMIWWARLMVLPFSLGLGWVVSRWATDLAGPVAGIAALAVYVLEPNMLARAGSTSSDIPVSLFLFLSVWTLWRWFVHPRLRTAALAGLWMGLAASTKYSVLVLGPVTVVMYILARRQRLPGASPGSATVAIVMALLAAQVPLLVVYHGETPMGLWWEGLQAQWTILAGEQRHYFQGQHPTRALWYYYPVAYLIKTPLPLLLLGGAGMFRIKGERAVLAALPLCLIVMSLTSSVQAGIRYLLPLYPFMCVIAGLAAAEFSKRVRGRVVIGVLAAWYVWGTVRVFPGYPFYFNEIVGGPERGWRWLQDTDVSINLKAMKDYVRRHRPGTVVIAGFDWSTVKPTYQTLAGAEVIGATPEERARFDPARVILFVPVLDYSHAWILERPFEWLHTRKAVGFPGYFTLAFDLSRDADARKRVGLGGG